MRRLLIGVAVAAATALVPLWAFAGNQEVADQIAARLKDSGQMRGYKIAVKYQDGTAWLQGQVSSREQSETASKIVAQTPGVQRVENGLAIAGEASNRASGSKEASVPNRQLQQALGAFAPDQLTRQAFSGARSAPIQQVSVETVQPQPAASVPAATPAEGAARADRVPTAFSTVPAQRVAAAAFQPPTAQPPAGRPPMPPVPSAPAPTPAPSAPSAVTPIPSAVMPAAPPQPMPTAPMAQPGTPLPTGQVPSIVAPYGAAPMGVPVAPYGPVPMGAPTAGVRHDQPAMPGYAWPAYAAHPNYAAVTYPKQYSPTAWPYIGPFYPYPQVPLGWRKVTMEWHDGWWNLDFEDGARSGPLSGIFRPWR